MSLKSVGKTKDTAVVELMHPITGEPLLHDSKPMTITVYGPYSAHYRAISNAQQNSRLQKAQRTGGKMNLTAEQIQASSLSSLVKCIKEWFVVVDKEPEEYSEENIRKVFEEFPWVREQVEAVFEDTKAFLG